MNDLSDEQQWLLQRAIDNMGGSGIPTADTLTALGASARDQRVVRERIEQMSAGVLR